MPQVSTMRSMVLDISMGDPIVLFLLLLGFFVTPFIWRSLPSRVKERRGVSIEVDSKGKAELDFYEDIDPLHDFDWSSTDPARIRPFKPKYFLTMALENCPLSELILMDKTYLDRLQLRQTIMDDHPLETYECNPVCEPALTETYEWMFGSYLPKRFPSIFKLDAPANSKPSARSLHNLGTNTSIPLHAASPKSALYTLGRNIDTDILILLPSSTSLAGQPLYHLQAYVCCFPSGFALKDKLGQPLAAIHAPVPGYKAKLEKSMDRFFAKMEVGKAVRRANWSITTNAELYSQGGNHLYRDEGGEREDLAGGSIEQQKQDVDVAKCRLRCERQTLHRLPRTKALVFMFKTYQYRLEDVKAEGGGLELADAIDGLTLGSTPEMAFYKAGVVWGEKVVEYLRSSRD